MFYKWLFAASKLFNIINFNRNWKSHEVQFKWSEEHKNTRETYIYWSRCHYLSKATSAMRNIVYTQIWISSLYEIKALHNWFLSCICFRHCSTLLPTGNYAVTCKDEKPKLKKCENTRRQALLHQHRAPILRFKESKLMKRHAAWMSRLSILNCSCRSDMRA